MNETDKDRKFRVQMGNGETGSESGLTHGTGRVSGQTHLDISNTKNSDSELESTALAEESLIQDDHRVFTRTDVRFAGAHLRKVMSRWGRRIAGDVNELPDGRQTQLSGEHQINRTVSAVILLLDNSGWSAFSIAACWSAKIPFIAVEHDASAARILGLTGLTDASIIAGKREHLERLKKETPLDIRKNLCLMETERLSGPRDDDEGGLSADGVSARSSAPSGAEGTSLSGTWNTVENAFVTDDRLAEKAVQTAAYFFTSGTSGPAKTVPLTRQQLCTAARNVYDLIPLKGGNQWLCPLPLHHIGGASIIIRAFEHKFTVRFTGATDTETLAGLLHNDKRIAAVSLVPTQLFRMVRKADWCVHEQFHAVLLGGGPISGELQNLCISRGIKVISSFGMTETGAACIAVPLADWKSAPPGSCGKPLGDLQCRIVPDVANRDEGVLWLRGSQVFKGYLEDYLNKDAFDQDGWFCTGDIVQRDGDGYYSVKMRRTDRIVTGGENVNPAEVESAIRIAFGLTRIGVAGLPDPEWGQVVALVVATGEPVPELGELRAALKNTLRNYEIPRRIIVTEQIPQTASGKIKRVELLRQLTQSD